MKLPTFNHAEMQWDAWQAFHVVHKHYMFIQFDTGEFVVCRNSWRPEDRQVYRDLHIQIVGTDDDDCPRLYIPGQDKPVPKSHLNHKGQQVLLLDLDHKRVVGLSPGLNEDNAPLVPRRFTDCHSRVTAYYPGPDAVPVGAPVIRHYPQPLTVDQRRHTASLVDACKVWLQMQPESEQSAFKRKYDGVGLKVADFVETPFSALTTDYRLAIARNGFNMIVKSEHPWLTFESNKSTNLVEYDDDIKAD